MTLLNTTAAPYVVPNTPPVQAQQVQPQLENSIEVVIEIPNISSSAPTTANHRLPAQFEVADRNHADEDRIINWMCIGALIGGLAGFGASMGGAYPEYLNTINNLSANPFSDVGDKAKAEGKLAGIVVGVTVAGAGIGATAGYAAAKLSNRVIRWWNS